MSETTTRPGHVLQRGGYLFALLSAVWYGSITTFATVAYETGVTVEHLVISRGFIVAAICLGLAMVTGQSLAIGRVQPHRLLGMALAFLATAFCQLGAVQYISVGLTVILFYTFPIFVTFHDMLAGRVRVGPRLFLPPFLALVGVVMAIGPGTGTLNITGVTLAVLASIAMAASIVMAQRCVADSSVLGLGLAVNLLASLLGVVLWGLTGNAHLPHFEPGQVSLGLAMTGAVGCLFGAGIIFQFLAIRRIGSIPTSMTLNFEPVVTLAVAAVLISEPLSGAKVGGASLIVLSVILSSLALQD